MKKLFCCPALELFHCLPQWKTVLFVSSRAFSLSTPVENSEATWKKATKCNKHCNKKILHSPLLGNTAYLAYHICPFDHTTTWSTAYDCPTTWFRFDFTVRHTTKPRRGQFPSAGSFEDTLFCRHISNSRC